MKVDGLKVTWGYESALKSPARCRGLPDAWRYAVPGWQIGVNEQPTSIFPSGSWRQ